jgi:hypothetical protein
MTYNPMTCVKKEKPKSSLLKAIFEHGTVSFELSDTATLADIAQRLDDATPLHVGAPVTIDVTFSPVAIDRQRRSRAEFRW